MPGDVIATGTLAGVGIGFNPPKFLQPGDSVTIQIDDLSELQNPGFVSFSAVTIGRVEGETS